MNARRAVDLLVAIFALTAFETTCLGSVVTTSAAASPNAPACQSKDLAIHGGRQGSAFQSVEGTVVVVNVSTFQCAVHVGTPFSFIQNDGVRLNVHFLTPTKGIPSIVLRAKKSTDLILSWNNWCLAHPGPLTISIALREGAGVVSGPFNGPPNYNAVPGCINTATPSTLQLVLP